MNVLSSDRKILRHMNDINQCFKSILSSQVCILQDDLNITAFRITLKREAAEQSERLEKV